MMRFSWTGWKRSAQEPGNKELDMDIRLYLSLNLARNDQQRLQG